VTPAGLHDFFVATAGVAGALIGLLFVAISVAHERLTAEDAEQSHRIRAAAALSSFSNALTISLFALVPGVGLAGTPLIVGLIGLMFIAASLLSVMRVRDSQPEAPRDVLFLFGLLITFALQVFYGLRFDANAHDTGAADGIAILVVVCFLIGIARSWELIGGPSIGLFSELSRTVRGGSGDSDGRPGDSDERPGDSDERPGDRDERSA